MVLCTIHFSISYSQLDATVIENDGWIKGNFVEIGINELGVYGANNNNRPSNFHDNRESDGNQLFGFIANPQKDGWVDYDGDFFTPGSPEEGFTIEIDGVNYSNNNSFSNQIEGEVLSASIFSSDCFEDYAQIVWSGDINGLRIRRFYSITEDGLFIQMITNITNISSSTRNDVFFLHNVDPDNNQTLSGSYDTNNELISQASSPTDKVCLVKASQDALMTPQDMDGSYVSLFANDERARVTYGGFDNRFASQVWNGTSPFTNTEGSSYSSDIAISIAFNLGDIEPSETINFTYYYILEEVDENFEPLIVNIVPVNPSICENNDGKFIISGLSPGEEYEIEYSENGSAIPLQTYTANSEGQIEIINLEEGTYSNFTIGYTGCTTTIDSSFELSDPPIYFNVNKVNPTSCNVSDGKLIIEDLVPLTTYTISYEKDGVLEPELSLTSDSSGIIEVTNLSPAIYNNILVKYLSCETESDENLTISHPDSPIFSLSKSDPTSCDGNEGVININGLLGNTSYDISYSEDGDTVSQILTTDGSGSIQITGLESGIYDDFIVNLGGCITETPVSLNLDGPLSPILDVMNPVFYCDENHDYIIDNLDLSIYDNEALNGLSSSAYSVSYHKDESDAINNIQLPKENYSTIGENTYTIYVRVTNDLNGCYSYIPFEINVNIPANFELEDDIICLNSDDTPNVPEFSLPILDTNISEDDYTFEWYLDGELIIDETFSLLTVVKPGTYDVIVTNKLTNCLITKTSVITPSGRPIDYEISIVSDYFANNDIVEITANGYGDYVYSMNGNVQESPIFENILPGIHDFCILDQLGCGDICEEVIIIDFMRYFTPNSDNYNDGWRIFESEYLINAQIFIYDRYGKVITELDPNGETWDGTYNGVDLPSTDYWFKVDFDDNEGKRRSFKSHFTLIRR